MFELDYPQKAQEITDWIREIVHNAGLQDGVIAVSGGIDSAVSLNLAVKSLGKEHVYAILLPYGDLSKKSLEDGQLVVKAAGLAKDHIFIRDVEPAVQELSKQVEKLTDIRQGNMMARMRMIYLFDIAKSLHALVIGTENKSEHFLGYFTRFGDEASDLEPIKSLYKTQVWGMGRYLDIPKEIIEKQPTAGLWESQTDEKEFGFSYREADKVLYYHFEENLSQKEIIAKGLEGNLVEKVLSFAAKNDFKHHVPYVFV